MRTVGSELHIKGSVLFAKPHSLAEYQANCTETLRRFRSISSLFNELFIVGASDFERIGPDLSELPSKISGALSRCKPNELVGEIKVVGLGPLTRHKIGFQTRYLSAKGPDEQRGIEISIRGNSDSAEPHGSIAMTLSGRESEPLLNKEQTLAVVEAIVSIWELNVAEVYTTEFQKAVAQPGDLYAGKWLNYFRDSGIKECLGRELALRPMCDGFLVEISPHVPYANNPSDLADGLRIRNLLDKFGLVWHSQYAIHGWPPDEEEWRYEDFISGAPRGRKYRVHCIDFDGYDSQRNVLLYAKLFRRLKHQRKEWGLRGWDGPVLNEAKRQVRAANGTPIEWHIGLEEPAERVRTLLADYTNFTESQLKIIYTPVSQMPA